MMNYRSLPDVPKGNLYMRALCLPVIGFGNWEQMEMRQRVQELVMAPLEALTGAMKNVVAPAPQSPLPKAAVGTAVVSGTGTESEIGNGIETENGNGTEIETENGIEIETGTGTEIETGTGTGIETERALSAGQTRSLNAGPLGREILSMSMEKT